MGINFNSSSKYKLLINQANQLNVQATQKQSSDNVKPVVISTSEGVNPNDVLSYLEGTSVLNGIITNSNTSKTTVDKELVALQEKADKAKELADKPNISLKATGSKTLTKEKACTKGRNMGQQAKELTTQYLDSQIKNQAKNAFLAKYTKVLTNAGHSTAQINSMFESLYRSAKTSVVSMAQNMDNSFVSYGNKGFLKNKGYVNVDTQKLVNVFTQKFNQKAATIAKQYSKKADAALEDYKATKKDTTNEAGNIDPATLEMVEKLASMTEEEINQVIQDVIQGFIELYRSGKISEEDLEVVLKFFGAEITGITTGNTSSIPNVQAVNPSLNNLLNIKPNITSINQSALHITNSADAGSPLANMNNNIPGSSILKSQAPTIANLNNASAITLNINGQKVVVNSGKETLNLSTIQDSIIKDFIGGIKARSNDNYNDKELVTVGKFQDFIDELKRLYKEQQEKSMIKSWGECEDDVDRALNCFDKGLNDDGSFYNAIKGLILMLRSSFKDGR